MGYKNYNFALWVRMLILLATAISCGYAIATASYMALTFFGLFMLVEVWELIRFLNKTHKQIDFFIKAIKNEDTTLRFPEKSGNSIINELHHSLNDLNGILQQVQTKSRIREKYFGEILQNISTGVIVLSENKHITDVNSAALELLGLPALTHISQLNRIDTRFTNSLLEISNRQKQVLELSTPKERVQINTACSVIRIDQEDIKLITLQDIRGELERKEVDAWIKLIRVLSHEIMNSLAPVTSIAQSLKRIWEEKSEMIVDENLETEVGKTVNGLGVITEMSEALIHFVKSYRMLSKPPKPILGSVNSIEFFDRLSILLSPIKEEFAGELQIQTPKRSFDFVADEQMIVQVIINLVKNAKEAFNGEAEHGKISVSCNKKGPICEINVIDNGPGIPAEIADEIFIPFFTTKTNGSGVGLSHSRQIIRAHGGSLYCTSKPNQTVFKLRW
ncbi:PAS domain-containing sensor histidine kinase [Marinifilum sp. D714]|uniref:sensor histidine kinase n=1 Tax=Marinifilum sp. D714 TaxID=2937523 RepID=UPI0027CA9248|nr:ATP-binding protein [Marinifilum sp. D714]MDQ2180351.1 ATP-binding protein [Marinifilum sp. D714]